MDYSIFKIADWFLTKQSMTPKKLQKLTYYVQAWGHALLNRPVINDTTFEAWAHGPVSSELYNEYRDFGWNDIPKLDNAPDIQDEKVNDLLESVWLTYGDMSANALEAQTHVEDPWIKARRKAHVEEGDRCNEIISEDDMRKFYLSIYSGD